MAAPPGWEEPAILVAEELGCGKVGATVTGGETRAASVGAALAEVPLEAAVVLVHDAARPLVSDAVIERLLRALPGWEGAVPVLPLSDTVKRVRGDEVVETLDRSQLVGVQTPQAFAADALRRAVGRPDAAAATDCASLVEAAGGRVRVVAGDRRLLKVTDQEDLALVERWLVEERR